ncbi:hypothetical protein B296_00005036 [Ensete ventricosum]|uniref:Bet v I/Major latex protein domain-containing protein n=1 Tax=Ensete ventricosum TaxID=4639 RepID=A0A427B4C5_ENSVE|nr:hypothetical protein B296_00005036 [Ensete ventricosum]
MESTMAQSKSGWEGRVTARIRAATPEQAWSLLKGFCSLHRWVPSVRTCHKLEGVEGEPGCVRYCGGPLNRSDPTQPTGWSKERLLAVDPAGRSYTYEIVETNKGFGRYRATFAVAPDPGCAAEGGCCLMWSFAADPVKGWTQQEFVAYLEKLAQGVAERVEAEIGLGVASADE